MTYLRSAGTLPFLVSLFFFFAFQTVSAGSNFWLSTWTDDPLLAEASSHFNVSMTEEYTARNDYYLMIFGLLGLAQG